MDEVSAVINQMQEGVARFQAQQSKLKNDIENMYLAALGDIAIQYYPQFLSTSLFSIPLNAMMPDPSPPKPLKLVVPYMLAPPNSTDQL